MNPSTFLFHTVLGRTLEFVLPILKEEIPKLKGSLEDTFDEFPRNNSDYADIITALTDVSMFDTTSVVKYLCGSLHQVFQFSFTKSFRAALDNLPEFDSRNKIQIHFAKHFQIIFYTDCIFSILNEDENFDGIGVDCVIKTAYNICAYATQQEIIAKTALPQWSVIMSLISKKHLGKIFDTFSAMTINKPENYFLLLRYVRLNSDDTVAQNLAEVMLEYIEKGKRKKIVTSRMLSAVSTMLLTINGNPDILNEYKKIANMYLQDPNLKYGAIELRCTLYPKGEKNVSEIREFYNSNVFSLANDPNGFQVVVRTYYFILVSLNIDPDWLFWVWGPKPRSTELKKIKTKKDDKYFTEVFMEHIFTSKYFATCSSELRDILVFLAQQNFNDFCNTVVNPFIEAEDPHKFITFLTIVPIINQDDFLNENDIDKSLLKEVNKKIAKVVFAKLQELVKSIDKNGIEESFEIDLAKETVKNVFQKWELDTGAETEKLAHDTAGDAMDLNAQMMDSIPYILNSDAFTIEEWTTLLVKLVACGNSNISGPASKIVEQNLDDPEIYMQLCRHIAGMVTLQQAPEIVWVCLELLRYAADGLEPKEDEEFNVFADELEYTAFIGLASENPEVRTKAFTLLGVMNILQRNDGLMTHIEKNISTIESNVKHSILMMQLPKKPGTTENRDMDLLLNDALLSPYQLPWLYFLSEFGRVLYSTPIAARIKKLTTEFLSAGYSHFSLGVLVIFLSSCINPEFSSVIYDPVQLSKSSNEKIVWADISNVIKNLMSRINSNDKDISSMLYFFTALKHANATIIPNVLNTIFTEFLVNSQNVARSPTTLENIATLSNILLRTIEEYPPIRKKACSEVFKFQSFISLRNRPKNKNYNEDEKFHLSYLNFLSIAMDTDEFTKLEGWDHLRKSQIFLQLSSILEEAINDPTKTKIGNYTSYAIMILVDLDPPFASSDISKQPDILDKFIWSEDHGYEILRPLCQRNMDIFIDIFIDRSFKQDQHISDCFFQALHKSVVEILGKKLEKGTDDPDIDLLFKNIDKLLLIGIYKLKTGSKLAHEFVEKLSVAFTKEFFKKSSDLLKQELEKNQPNEALAQIFVKKCEAIVQNALNWMAQSNFEGSPKVMVDILIPWLRNFRLLPNSSTCIPNINSVVNRMTPASFLDILMKITQNSKKQDFETICDLWAILLEKDDHKEVIPNYLAEIPNQELKRNIFMYFLGKHPKIIIGALARRCKFSFYAYISYQKEKNYEDQLWFIYVIQKAVKNSKETDNYLPIILQFALVFQSNQTQNLLKRLCKKYGVPYSKRTLSIKELRKIVSDFIKKLTTLDCFHIEEWASEATRWVVGSKNIKIAHTSLVILNEIQREHPEANPKNLFYGIYRSVSYFLQQCKDAEHDPIISDYINETFVVFINHFKGNEEIAFDYIKIYFDFVVSVDEYFDKMIPLYLKCKQSPVTGEEAKKYLLGAIRPIFNELESDSKAMATFQKVTETEKSVDIEYVNIVLHPIDDKEKVKQLIKRSTLEERSRAFSHYNFMAINASTDLKRRIFTVSSMILNEIIEEREIIQNYTRLKPIQPNVLESSSLATQSMSPAVPEIDLKNFQERIKKDINKTALVGIFRAALAKITTMKEAVEFICFISKIDPLLPNTVAASEDENKWTTAANKVVEKLNNKFKDENDIVTLTDCEHLDSTSNLLSKESKPKILPFTTQHEMVESISKPNKSEATPVRHMQKWVKALTDASFAFQKGMTVALSPSTTIIGGNYVKLKSPSMLLDNKKVLECAEEDSKPGLIVSMREFVSIGVQARRISRPGSTK